MGPMERLQEPLHMRSMETSTEWQENIKPEDVELDFSGLMERRAMYMNTGADPEFTKKDLLVTLKWLYFCKKDLILLQDENSFEFAKYVMSRTSNEIAGLSDSDHAKMEFAGLDHRDFQRFAKVENLAEFIAKLEKN